MIGSPHDLLDKKANMPDQSITLTMTAAAMPGATLLCPIGMSTPHVSAIGFRWTGGRGHIVSDPTSGQNAVVLAPDAANLRLRWSYALGGLAYPEIMFAKRDTRFARAADALVTQARHVVAQAPGDPVKALADHVAAQFTYGHPDTRFYDNHDNIPQLCSITEGSCVDINAYFIAACRTAGIDAGYVTGCFLPAEKRTHCNDMHCWVVTRLGGEVREWDIAHHLKMNTRDIQPGLNPKPGARVPLAHSMGLNFPTEGVSDLKLIGEPMWLDASGTFHEANPEISFQGYEVLNQARI